MNLHKKIVFFLSLLLFSTLGSVAFASNYEDESIINEQIINPHIYKGILSIDFINTKSISNYSSTSPGVYICNTAQQGARGYVNPEGNNLYCPVYNQPRSTIMVSGEGFTATNYGMITSLSNNVVTKGMEAIDNANIINYGTVRDHNYGMSVTNANAINNGTVECNAVGIYSSGNSMVSNNGTIKLISCSGVASGSYIGISSVNTGNSFYSTNETGGKIICTPGSYDKYYGANVENSKFYNMGGAFINGCDIGINAVAGSGTSTVNNAGTISCLTHSRIIDTIGINSNKSSVLNSGTIVNCGVGISQYGYSGSGIYALNNGTIFCHTETPGNSIGMKAVSGGWVKNSSTGDLKTCGVGMLADGYDVNRVSAYAENYGKISCVISEESKNDIGAQSTNAGRVVNSGLIQNCAIGMVSEGYLSGSYQSFAQNAQNGSIKCQINPYGVGMLGKNNTTLTNEGLIQDCGVGISANNNTTAINKTTGVIRCSGQSYSIGSIAKLGANVNNQGQILNCGINMVATGTNSTVTNNGTITCSAGGSTIGMNAEDGGLALNSGTIQNCKYGMQASLNSTAINDVTGVIKCANTTGIGMRSINGGTIANRGQIIGCSDSPATTPSSDEPSISLAIAMADDETSIPSTPSTGSNPRGALSYDIASGVTASYINSGLTNQSMGGSFVDVTGSGTLAIKNSGTILCGSGLEECFGMNGTHNTTYEASVGAGNTMGSVIVLDDSTINIPQTSIIGGAIPDKEYTYKDVFVSSGGGSITGADNITSGSIVWNVTPVANDHSVDVIVTKNSYTDLASAEHSAIASVLEANYNGSNLYQSLNQKDIKSFNSALNQLSGADLSGGRGANLDSMSLINKADSGFNSRQDFISSYEGSYEKQSSFASNVGDITMGETQNQLTDNVTVRSVMAISQVSNNPLYNTYSYRYAGRVGLGKNYGFYTNTQLLQASSYNARTMDLGSGVSTLGRIENVTAIISDNYAYVSAKASDNVTLLAYSGASTSYSIFSNATEQASSSDMQFAALNLGGYNQTVVSAVLGQEIAYKSKTNGTLSLMAKVSTPIMSVGNERTASFSTGESFIVNTGAEIGVYTATLGMNYLLGDTSTKGFNAKVSAYREINSIEINDNAYATLGYAF